MSGTIALHRLVAAQAAVYGFPPTNLTPNSPLPMMLVLAALQGCDPTLPTALPGNLYVSPPPMGESTCGDANNWQDVESYDGALGPSVDFVDRHERAVGYIDGTCTGTLVSYNLFLTAGHCFSDAADAEGATVLFNYQNDPNGAPRTPEAHTIEELVEHEDTGDGTLDYALVRLSGSPGYTWGTTAIDGGVPFEDEAITIIQHPGGIPKVIEAGSITTVETSMITYNNLDTDGGSSGAGILNAHGQITGVHTQGGCEGRANSGVRMDYILASGSIIGGSDHLWLGQSNGNFDTSVGVTNAGGTYVAIGGDFDGDGRSDIFWYGRGTGPDYAWYGTGTGTFTSRTYTVSEEQWIPLVGDFDHDGRSDIFWYGPGTVSDRVWYGNTTRAFTSKSFTVSASIARPVAGDFDGDGYSDIFWYNPGAASDSVWFGRTGRAFTSKAFTVNGADYQPVAGDFNGDGEDDIFWYGPGSVGDSVWSGRTTRTFVSSTKTVTGHYQPFAGDFNGDGEDDIFWYGPSTNPDYVWLGDSTGGFTSIGSQVSGIYTPIPGRYNSDARTDIFWYRPG
jgi:hypothetical protein